jgi:hypothetical protein
MEISALNTTNESVVLDRSVQRTEEDRSVRAPQENI